MNKPIDLDEARKNPPKQARRRPLPAVPADGLPVIHLTTELHRVVDQAAAALSTEADTYQREGRLVRVLRVAKDEETAQKLEGTPIIRQVTGPSLRETLTRVACWLKFSKRDDSWEPCLPSEPTVEALLERGAWRGIRPITGIAEAPMFLRDGTIVQTPGYDRATGYLYAPTCEFTSIPERPNQDDAKLALADLQEVLADFPWRSPADASVPVAMLLSILARPALGNVPGFLFDANQMGSGKSLVVDSVMMIATGRGAPKQSYTAEPKEQDKVIGSYALEGASFVNYDNIREPFGGAPIELTLTCGGAAKLRILGKSKTPTIGWTGIISATGNNIVLCGDVARRVLMSRIETDLENPERRNDFAHPQLLQWVQENRPRLVVAALTMLRAWHLHGRKTPFKPMGSFEEWAAMVPPAIVFAGGADPMACCPDELGVESDEKSNLRTLVQWWPQIAPEGATIKAVLSELYPDGRAAKSDPYDSLRETLESLANAVGGRVPDGKKLGYAFRALQGQIVGGRKLTSPRSDRVGSAVWLAKLVGPAGDAGHAGHFPIPTRKMADANSGSRDSNIAFIGSITSTDEPWEDHEE